jgi:hypothetical protein
VLLVSFLATTIPALADSIAAPTGKVILTVKGQIGVTNADATARMDMDMIKSLPAREFTTGSIWYDGTQTFRGVPLDALMAYLQAEGTALKAKAINDYVVTMPIDAGLSDGPILAYQIDGAPIPVREKGPLWIVYPYDQDRAFRTEVIYGRSIWQLEQITIVTE